MLKYSPSNLVSMAARATSKFDIVVELNSENINFRVLKGQRTKVMEYLTANLPKNFVFTVTEDFDVKNPVGMIYSEKDK